MRSSYLSPISNVGEFGGSSIWTYIRIRNTRRLDSKLTSSKHLRNSFAGKKSLQYALENA